MTVVRGRRKSAFWLLYKWHRYTGLSVALVVVMLSITGIMINHTEDLQLDRRFVGSDFILDWYGIQAPEAQQSFVVGSQWLTQLGESIFLDERQIMHAAELQGALKLTSHLLLAFPEQLILLTEVGEVIERVDRPQQVQSGITGIGIDARQSVYIATAEGVYFSADELLSWHLVVAPIAAETVRWAKPAQLPEQLQEQLVRVFRSGVLPWERILLDIHSGRFFGRYGVYVIDLATVLLALLAVTGSWIWLHHKLK